MNNFRTNTKKHNQKKWKCAASIVKPKGKKMSENSTEARIQPKSLHSECWIIDKFSGNFLFKYYQHADAFSGENLISILKTKKQEEWICDYSNELFEYVDWNWI